MPNISIEEFLSVLAGIVVVFAGGVLSRAGQDAWTATKRRVNRRHRRHRRRPGNGKRAGTV